MSSNGFHKDEADLNKVVTLGALLEYTDDFLIPRMSEMMDEKFDDTLNGIRKELRTEMGKGLAVS